MRGLASSTYTTTQNSGSTTQTDRDYLMALAEANRATASRQASLALLGSTGHIHTVGPVLPYNPTVASSASLSQVGREEQLRMYHWEMANMYAGSRYAQSPMSIGGAMAYQSTHVPLPFPRYDVGMYRRYPRLQCAASNVESEFKSGSPTLAAGRDHAELESAYSPTRNSPPDFKSLWGKRYSQLKEFKRANGHCNVPQRYAANAELGRWVKDQRTAKVKGKLSKERIDLLGKIGFVWRIKDHSDFWNKMCKELVSFKAANGHCNVSMSNTKNLQLARWVDRSRRGRKNGKLSDERIRQLDEIGFSWSTR